MDLLVAVGIKVRLGANAVLRGIDLAAAEGEILGVFGPSGAGKSTLFRALAGEEPLTAGRVLLAGEDVTPLELWERARRGLGYLPQSPSVLWDLTVAENMDVFRRLAVSPTSAAAHRARRASVNDIAIELGLGDRMNVAASALSGGERRRLELARAVCASPRVLLCDEPFAAVDPAGAERMAEVFRRVAATGTAVILADHRAAEALRLCDRAALLVDGSIALMTNANEFARHTLVQERYAILGSS